MAFDPARVRALVFDYGNTLIPYGRAELTVYGDRLHAAIEDAFGPLDRSAFDAHRQASRMAPFAGTAPSYRETDLRALSIELVERFYGRAPSAAQVDDLLQVRHAAFVESIVAGREALAVLGALKARYPLALLSNYPDGPAIRASLDRIGMTPYFDAIVISGELGYCKPHPITFATVLQALALPAQAVAHVGDNWLADVQGAKRVGMQMIYTTEYVPPEEHTRAPEDHQPDLIIRRLSELTARLGV